MRKLILFGIVLILLSSLVSARSNDPSDFIIWDMMETAVEGYNTTLWTEAGIGDVNIDAGSKTEGGSSVYFDVGSQSAWLTNKTSLGEDCSNCRMEFDLYIRDDKQGFRMYYPEAGTYYFSYLNGNWGGQKTDLGCDPVVNQWNRIRINFSAGDSFVYIMNTTTASYSLCAIYEKGAVDGLVIGFNSEAAGYDDSNVDNFTYGTQSAYAPPDGGEQPPNITYVNCISGPESDNLTPYTTYDTTPTFNITTDINAWCRIRDVNETYSTMVESRNCTTTGTKNHICTLHPNDELIYSTDYVYISCATSYSGAAPNSTTNLTMNITNLEINTSKAIDIGIERSKIGPSPTKYEDQQVYIRDLYDNQTLATVDRVVRYGLKRWLLNYAVDGNLLGLFNITTAVYVLDMKDIPMYTITNKVSVLINDTYI